jgi:hypothetical protein
VGVEVYGFMSTRSIQRAGADLEVKRAFTQLFKDDSGELRPDAKMFVAKMQAVCMPDSGTVQFDKQGRVDEFATMVMNGRLEVWAWFIGNLEVPESKLVEADNFAVRLIKAGQNKPGQMHYPEA